jgi:signal transduction histidine kinase
VQVEGSLPRLWADRIQIGQLLQNLVSNAIKFGPERGGVIEICADHAAEGWGIHVRDHGRGIAEKDQSRIFEPFRRLRGTGSIPGDGLGLAICRQIVAAHGGILTVQSSVGAGATFSFVLPDGPRGEGRSPKQ